MSDINNNETDEMDIEMIDITYEDGTSCTCEIIAKFEVNDISYAALIVYSYSEQVDDVTLDEITDEAEFNDVADALDEILDDLEFNSDDEE